MHGERAPRRLAGMREQPCVFAVCLLCVCCVFAVCLCLGKSFDMACISVRGEVTVLLASAWHVASAECVHVQAVRARVHIIYSDGVVHAVRTGSGAWSRGYL